MEQPGLKQLVSGSAYNIINIIRNNTSITMPSKFPFSHPYEQIKVKICSIQIWLQINLWE
jgi:hypothetical protein